MGVMWIVWLVLVIDSFFDLFLMVWIKVFLIVINFVCNKLRMV